MISFKNKPSSRLEKLFFTAKNDHKVQQFYCNKLQFGWNMLFIRLRFMDGINLSNLQLQQSRDRFATPCCNRDV